MLGSNVKSEDSEDVDINELTRRLNNHRPFNIHPRGARFKDQPNRSRTQHKPPPTQNVGPFCKFCVGHHRRGRQYCPGWDHQCEACGQKNHLPQSKICKRKNVRNVNEEIDDEEDVEFLFLDCVELDNIDEESDEELTLYESDAIEVLTDNEENKAGTTTATVGYNHTQWTRSSPSQTN